MVVDEIRGQLREVNAVLSISLYGDRSVAWKVLKIFHVCYNIMLSVWHWRSFCLYLFFYSVRYLWSEVTRHDTEDLMWPKHHMTDWLSPLAWLDLPCTILALSHTWPSPLWAYSTFLYLLCLSISLIHLFPLCSVLFYFDLWFLLSLLILFISIPFHSVDFYVLLVISQVSTYINHCTNSRKP